MRLDERAEAEPLGRGQEVTEERRFEDRDDQEDGVGAGGARLPELVLVDREVLAQERDAHGATDVGEVLQPALKVFLVGQDRDRGGAVVRVGPCEPDRIP